MEVSAKGIKRSGVKTLNDVAFMAVPKLVQQASGDMNFRRNARAALGWQYEKATIASMQATIYTERGWFGLHSKEGDRRPSSGVKVNGRPMLLIPSSKGKRLINAKGRISEADWARIYFVQKGDYALAFYRKVRKRNKGSELIGIAVTEAKFHKDTDWDGVISRVWNENAAKLMRDRLEDRAAFEARRR